MVFTMDEWAQLARDIGLPAVLLIMLGGAVWVSLKYLADRLLDDAHGILPQMVRDNREFLDGLAKRHEQQLDMCNQHGLAITKLCGAFGRPDEYSTIQTNHALAAIIDAELVKLRALETVQNGEKKAVERLLIEAKTRLENS
jgi:hypothetical protein